MLECSFCGYSGLDVKMIQGPTLYCQSCGEYTTPVQICEECIKECIRMLDLEDSKDDE